MGFPNPKWLFMSEEEIKKDKEERASKSCGCAIMLWTVAGGLVAIPYIFFSYEPIVGWAVLLGLYFLLRYGYVKSMGGSGMSMD